MPRWMITSDDLWGLKDAIRNIISEAVENGEIECDEGKIKDIAYKVGEIVGFILEMELND